MCIRDRLIEWCKTQNLTLGKTVGIIRHLQRAAGVGIQRQTGMYMQVAEKCGAINLEIGTLNFDRHGFR